MPSTKYNASAPYETSEYEYDNIVYQYNSGIWYEQPGSPYGGESIEPGYFYRSYVWHLNRLAGTLNAADIPTLQEAGAANAWAGTTGFETVGALNRKAGIFNPALFLDLQGVLNKLAGTTGLGPNAAAARIVD